MPTHDKETADDAHSPQPAAQQEPGSSITDKIGYGFTRITTVHTNIANCASSSGVANVIHGKVAYTRFTLYHNFDVSS